MDLVGKLSLLTGYFSAHRACVGFFKNVWRMVSLWVPKFYHTCTVAEIPLTACACGTVFHILIKNHKPLFKIVLAAQESNAQPLQRQVHLLRQVLQRHCGRHRGAHRRSQCSANVSLVHQPLDISFASGGLHIKFLPVFRNFWTHIQWIRTRPKILFRIRKTPESGSKSKLFLNTAWN